MLLEVWNAVGLSSKRSAVHFRNSNQEFLLMSFFVRLQDLVTVTFFEGVTFLTGRQRAAGILSQSHDGARLLGFSARIALPRHLRVKA